jgi:hypothetical protein
LAPTFGYFQQKWREAHLRGLILAGLATVLAFPAQADTRTVGSFSVDRSKDPIDDTQNIVAMSVQGTNMLIVRCLADGQSLLVGFPAEVSIGDAVDLQFRVDQTPAQHLTATILNTVGRLATFELAEPALVSQLSGAKTVAIRVGVSNSTTTITFALRESAKVVAEVQKACATRKEGS